MKMIRNTILRIMMGIFCLLLLCRAGLCAEQAVYAAAAPGGSNLFDQAGLFDEGQTADIELQMTRLEKELNAEVVVVTTDDAGGKPTGAYADDFYIDGGFGVGSDYTGLMFVIDLDNREIYVNAVGKMTRVFTDQRKEQLLDAAFEEIAAGNYQGTVDQFFKYASDFGKEGVVQGQYNQDEETGRISRYKSVTILEFLAALAIALAAAGIACANVKSRYAMKSQHNSAAGSRAAYREAARFALSQNQDRCMNTRVLQRRIPRSSSSGGGRSSGGSSSRSSTHRSSGRTFSGRGRKF